MNEMNNSTAVEEKPSFLKRIRKALWKHKLSSLLALLLILVLIWSAIRLKRSEKQHEAVTSTLINQYELQIDSIQIANMILTVRVFTWAIRGELIRNNLDQVDQYFTRFIKEPQIARLQLIHPDSLRIILSTNRKDEGMILEDKGLSEVDKITIQTDSTGVRLINPIMGLDEKIGLLIVEVVK